MSMKIAIILGTTRPKRKSIHAARLIEEIATEFSEIETVFVDPQEYDLSRDGNDEENKIPAYSDIVRAADGFFIVTPEYNRSFPGSLKSLLDKELKAYIHKPVAFAGVSAGMTGGARVVESLIAPVREMGMVPTFAEVFFPKVQEMFDEEGTLLDDDQRERVRNAYRELIWMCTALKWGRENITGEED